MEYSVPGTVLSNSCILTYPIPVMLWIEEALIIYILQMETEAEIN